MVISRITHDTTDAILTLFTGGVRRLRTTQFFQFQITFLNKCGDLTTKLRSFHLQSGTVRKEAIFDSLHMQLLQVLHLAIDLIDVRLDLFLNVDVHWRQVPSTQRDRALTLQASAIIELIAIVGVLRRCLG